MHHYECVVLCKDISLQRLILCQISSLMYPKIQRRQVIMNVVHPHCARPPRWSPPVLWRRFKDGLASICILVHSHKMPKESEMTGLDGWKWLVGCGWLVMRQMSAFLTKSCQRMLTSSCGYCIYQGSQHAWEILENAWIWNKNFKALESAWKQIRCLKVVENPEKSLNLNLANFEILLLSLRYR